MEIAIKYCDENNGVQDKEGIKREILGKTRDYSDSLGNHSCLNIIFHLSKILAGREFPLLR